MRGGRQGLVLGASAQPALSLGGWAGLEPMPSAPGVSCQQGAACPIPHLGAWEAPPALPLCAEPPHTREETVSLMKR